MIKLSKEWVDTEFWKRFAFMLLCYISFNINSMILALILKNILKVN
jgi:hypothetical protein